MDRNVRVRRRKNSPYTLAYFDPPPGIDLARLQPSMQFARIWLCVVPPHAERSAYYPAYACVLGEEYSAFRADRPIHLLDEASALFPGDFTEEEQDRFNITSLQYDNPNAYALRRALVSLKDIWWPSQVLVPADDENFYDFVLRTDGLLRYDDRRSDRYFRRNHPLFLSRGRCADEGIVKAEKEYYQSDPKKFTDGQADQGLFFWEGEHGKMFGEQKLPTALRAVAMGLSEMQWRSADYIIDTIARSEDRGDGYGGRRQVDPALVAWQEHASETVDNIRELFGA